MRRHLLHALIGIAIVLGVLPGCGGSGGSQPPVPAVASKSSSAVARTTITIVIPAVSAAARARRPAYVSPSTQSATIVAGGISTTANLTPTSPGCVTSPSLTCTITGTAPIGAAVPVQVTLFSGLNATGNQLSSQTVTATVTAAGPNTLALTLNGVVDHIAVILTPTSAVPSGAPATLPVAVDIFDASNNIIIGPGGFVDANGNVLTFTLTDSDTSGATTLTPTSITAPAPSVTLQYSGGAIAAATISVKVAGGTIAGGIRAATFNVTAATGTITEYALSAGSAPRYIVTGPDGNLWFAEAGTNKIGTMTTAGTLVAEYPACSAGSDPVGITTGPDGNLWFTEWNIGKIGKMSTSGACLGEFALPLGGAGGNPHGITVGSDGNLWFTEFDGSRIGNVTPGGTVTEFGGYSGPWGIAPGPDGKLWTTDLFDIRAIGSTVAGVPAVSLNLPYMSQPHGIVTGSDGNLWVADYSGNIDTFTTGGALVATYPVPSEGGANPNLITLGPNPNLYFADNSMYPGAIGKVTPAGAITEYPIPTAGGQPYGIALGPDGNLWFTEETSGKVGKMAP